MDTRSQRLEVSGVPEAIRANIDLFICSSSFEERCTTVAKVIEPSQVGKVILTSFGKPGQFVVGNYEFLLRRFGEKIHEVTLDHSNPLITADSLENALSTVQPGEVRTCLVDITTFSHESLMILVKLIFIRPEFRDTVYFVYTSASEYSPGMAREEKWLSKGVAKVRTVLGYPGETIPEQDTHLIIMVGYENERAASLIEIIEPNTISLGFGSPGTATGSKHQEANEHFHGLLKSTSGFHGETNNFTFSCDNPGDAKKSVQSQVAQAHGKNIIVAPMNNKISTVGAALAALENPAIQLCYAQAMQYNYRNYSSPSEMCHLFKLPWPENK